MPPLSVIIVDDHPLFLKGMSDFLIRFPVIKSVRTCLSRDHLFQELDQEIPDVIFLDLRIPPHDGFIICQELVTKYPHVHVLIITQYDVASFALKAKKCGARAYFYKGIDPEIIIQFLTNLAYGNINEFFACVSDTITSKVLFETDSFELRELLTAREREILELIIQGIAHEEIEGKLQITNSTYKGHRMNIYRKLRIKNDFELALFAIKHNLLQEWRI
jgi:DNA-binding NarL/FixJ family response regulator